jgi:8-oxo-dGTP pyrophosphatase MutT (NUDIX family)
MIDCSGALILSKSTNRVLLLQKSTGRNSGTWGLVGGTGITGESSIQCLLREITEEIGQTLKFKKVIPLEKFVSSDNGFKFHTYLCIIDEEFIPQLSDEHTAWGWFSLSLPPKPVHRGLYSSLRNKTFQSKIDTILTILDLFD